MLLQKMDSEGNTATEEKHVTDKPDDDDDGSLQADEEQKHEKNDHLPIDRGWAWVIMFGKLHIT